MIKLQITEFVENKNYENEMKEYNAPYSRGVNIDHPISTLEERRMEIIITQKQFEAIRKAVLSSF